MKARPVPSGADGERGSRARTQDKPIGSTEVLLEPLWDVSEGCVQQAVPFRSQPADSCLNARAAQQVRLASYPGRGVCGAVPAAEAGVWHGLGDVYAVV